MRNFTKISIYIFFSIIVVFLYSFRSGPGGGYANDPSQTNCTNCHTGTVNTGSGKLTDLSLTGDFFKGGYVPDSTYTITVAFKQSGINRFGFQTTALVSSNNNPAGTLSSSGNRNQKSTKTISGKTRQYITHTATGTDTLSKDSINWKFKWKAPSTNLGDIKFYVSVNATNKNNQNSGDQVYVKTFIVPISGVPEAKITVTNTNVCINEDVQFTGSATENPTKWNWTFTGSTTTSSTLQNPKIKFNSAGMQTATLIATNAKGKSKPVVLNMNVQTKPNARIFSSDTVHYCQGDSILLRSTFLTNVNYKWSPNGETTRNIYAKTTGNYQVTLTPKSGGCDGKSNIVVVNESKWTLATLKSNKAWRVCEDQTIKLTAGPASADSFFFYMNNQLISAQDSQFLHIKLDSNSNFFAQIKVKSGCSLPSDTIDHIHVKKPQKPTLTCHRSTPSIIEVRWNLVKNVSQYKIRINNEAWRHLSISTFGIQFTNLDPNTNYKISLIADAHSPCKSEDTTFITCKTKKCDIQYTISSPSSFCKDEPLTLNIQNLNLLKYNIHINGKSATLTNTFFPTNDTTYNIKVIDTDNPKCPSKDTSHSVKIKLMGSLDIQYFPKDTVCFGKDVLLSSKLPRSNYEVFRDGKKVGITHNQLLAIPIGGDSTHQIYVTAIENGCKVKSDVKTIHFLPEKNISFTKIRNYKEYSFTPSNKNLISYKWIRNGKEFSNQMNAKTSVETDETEITITLIGMDEFGCEIMSTQKFTTPKFSTIGTLDALKISVYPNPAHGQFYVDLTQSNSNYVNISIYDIHGKIILRKSISKSQDIKLAVPGVYYLKLINSKGERSNIQLINQ